MKFAKLFTILVVIAAPTFLFSQDEFVDDFQPSLPQPMNAPQTPTPVPPSAQNPNNMGRGIFDEELEPLDDADIVRPAPAEPMHADTPSREFPEPKKLSSGPAPKTLRALPSDIPNRNDKVKMDFIQVEIEEVLKYFAERLKRKFIYDPTILSGKITIISPDEVSLSEAYAAFLSAMEVRGYIIFPSRDGKNPYFKVEKAANARKAPVPVIQGSVPNDDSYVTRIITLKYLSVNDIRTAVRNLLSRTGGDVIEHPPTNTLIISDYAYNIRRIVRILNILDVESFQEQIAVIQLKHASAADVSRKINEFFPLGAGARIRQGGDIGGAPGAAGGVVQKVVADERTNSIILNGSDAGIDKVKKFIDQIDIPVEGGGGLIHVYALQNVKAEDISQTLSSLTSGMKKGRSGGGSQFPNPPTSPTPMSNDQGVASLLNGDVKITSDQATNSLVIQASQRDYDVLKTIIKKLDIRRQQVFIESAILETTVSNVSDFGTQYSGPFARTSRLQSQDTNPIQSGGILSVGDAGNSLEALLANPTSLMGLALGFRSGGSVAVKKSDGSTIQVPLMSAILRLSATNSNINLLSTPHILATANEEATITIGSEVPQISQESSTTGGNPLVNYTRIQVAKELSITPQINSGDYLTLKIKQKVNELGAADPKGQYTTKKREATTTAIVKDSQTIVIGGLMEDRDTVTINKVPFLGDIPILGWLFKSRRKEVEKVNFLLFVTPHIIRDTADMNDTFFRKIKERQGILKDLGVPEKKNIPVSGLTEDQLKMLDESYVKSLQLIPIKSHTEIKEETLPLPSQVAPTPEQKTEAPKGNLNPAEVMPTPAPAPSPAPQAPATPEALPQVPQPERPMQLEDAPPEEIAPPATTPGKNKTI